MTRKDFEMIASVLKNTTELTGTERKALAWEFAMQLGRTNDRFDKQLFVKAATVGK